MKLFELTGLIRQRYYFEYSNDEYSFLFYEDELKERINFGNRFKRKLNSYQFYNLYTDIFDITKLKLLADGETMFDIADQIPELLI